MRIYRYDRTTGELLPPAPGYDQAQLSPLEPGQFLIPAFATDIPPPTAADGQRAIWRGKAWELEDIPAAPVPPPAPEPTPTEVRAKLSRAVDAWLNSVAQQWDYRNIVSAVSYRGDPDPIFAAEAESLFNWRSQVFAALRAREAAVTAGTEPVPSAEALIASLPQPPARPAQAA